MGGGTLGTGIERNHIAAQTPGAGFESTQQKTTDTARAVVSIGHQVIDVKPATFVGILNHAPDRDPAHGIALRGQQHARPTGKHLGQAS